MVTGGNEMKVVPVTNFKQIDTTRYIEGDIFLAGKEIAVLQNGKIEPLVKKSDLKEYVKKKDLVKMMEELKQVKNND